MEQRKGAFLGNEVGYVAALVDEIEFTLDVTWPKLEKQFGRHRSTLQFALARRNRNDLIQLVHSRTYGVVGQARIASVVNRRETPSKRDRIGRFSK